MQYVSKVKCKLCTRRNVVWFLSIFNSIHKLFLTETSNKHTEGCVGSCDTEELSTLVCILWDIREGGNKKRQKCVCRERERQRQRGRQRNLTGRPYDKWNANAVMAYSKECLMHSLVNNYQSNFTYTWSHTPLITFISSNQNELNQYN